ncbi:lysylphosphatidylglycerol synthase transmembrane domain-containing protein [Massilia sp. W12]|uniref:lysylphosphatidylglycerol synthase transmembrane domain-containing protein n=1 Tax=Massilia sp. W12 TaxID=3126507 RepID=UPI0030D4BFBD
MKARHLLTYGAVAAFALWCAAALRADLAQISFAPLLAAPGLLLGVAALSLLNYGLRLWRWDWYLRRLGHQLPPRLMGLGYLAGFAFTLSPGKVGEMVRARYYQPAGVGLPACAAAFFVERLMDLFAMLALAAWGLAAIAGYAYLVWPVAALLSGALATLACTPWASLQTRFQGQSKRAQAVRGLLQILQDARALLSPGILLAGFALGVCAWGLEGLGLGLLARIYPAPALAWPDACGIYAIAIIIGALSFLPGGLGSAEAAMTALLHHHGFTLPQALLLTLACRLLTLWLAVLLGWLAVWRLQYDSSYSSGPI